jgi:hypothetical protein
MSTLDRLLPASAFFSAPSSVASLAWLKSSEPLSGTVLPTAEGLADAPADEEVVTGVLLELLDELEQAVTVSNAPTLAASPAANFLFMQSPCFRDVVSAMQKASRNWLNFRACERSHELGYFGFSSGV